MPRVIELTVRVAPPQAASGLHHVLAGPGGLGFIMDSAVDGENIALTCDAEHFSASLLRAAMNAALHAHLGASAVVELRKPLDDALIAQIAAEGLNAPELSANRILEVQLHAAGFDD